MVYDGGSAGERKMFSGDNALGEFKTEPPYGLSQNEAERWVRLVWMTAGMGMLGEDITTLSAQRYGLLERCFPLKPGSAEFVDDYSCPDVAVLRTKTPRPMVGMFNLSNKARTVRLTKKQLKLQTTGKFREWLSGEELALAYCDELEFPTLAPRSGRIWMVEPYGCRAFTIQLIAGFSLWQAPFGVIIR